MTHAVIISFAIDQFTILYLSAEPTPITLPTTTWVVETGAPNQLAAMTDTEADNCEFRLLTGLSL